MEEKSNGNSPASEAPQEQLAGILERVTYHNEDNGFCVLRVQVRGQRDLVTVVGHSPAISPGEYLQCRGVWFNDRTHGLQFKASFLRALPPNTLAGMEKYLASGLIKGIGPHYAAKLVKAFGEQVFEVIEHQARRLGEVSGIGAVRAAKIVAGWAEQKTVREIMVFLHANGVGTSRAVRIYKTYGAEAIELITENPYRLARDIRGIGFVTADAVAQRMGIAKDAVIRCRAGIGYALAEARDEGHCGLPEAELISLAETLLEVEQERITAALELELAEGTVIRAAIEGQDCVFSAVLYHAERSIAGRIQTLLQGDTPWPVVDAELAVPWAEKHLSIQLADSQQEAVRLALTSKVLVITGGPGVGKTTIINTILTILAAKRVKTALCAPTGRAAKRLAESTGREAKTIHRLLEVDPANGGFKRNEHNVLECELLVVDEASMIDVPLMYSLMRAVPDKAALILVGDVDQLPSVGPGQVLNDLINAAVIPVVRLTEVFRQAAASRIITNAHRINRGLMPEPTPAGVISDFYFVDAAEPEDAVAKIIKMIRERIPARFKLDPVRDVQVLCPMNRGGVGARSLNLELKAVLNPAREPMVERFGWTYSVGDKVMQIENDYDKEVYNGDLGFIQKVDTENTELVIDFDGRPVNYDFGELDQITPAYATSIHKSQGSEYPAVVIPVMTQHYAMLYRNLIYTGVTRGRQLVVLVGQRKALAIAVKGVRDRRRWSRLKEWLQETMGGAAKTDADKT
ncbi:MAG TPA: ATP-dependent RecD-like DNA helicase [Patescibacteria group bacterium]|nr:ATP-dependent RecD-like DNA helicase [Patescibacteria group bacterium]